MLIPKDHQRPFLAELVEHMVQRVVLVPPLVAAVRKAVLQQVVLVLLGV
jgi:hypothetical protein